MKNAAHVPVVAMLCVMCALAAAAGGQADSLLSLIPPAGSMKGWTQEDSARVYEGEGLYTFIDGGADLFFEYGFRRSLGVEYQNDPGQSIRIEIHQMSDPGAAYGIYSIRSGESPRHIDIGQGGCEHAYYIMFWKGPFYVSIAASDSTGECRNGIETLARAIDAAIPARAAIQPLAGLLPPQGLTKERYIRGFLGLLSTPAFGIAELFPAAEGVVGTYSNNLLVCMRYGDDRLAQERAGALSAALRSSDRVRASKVRESITRYSLRDNRTLCFARVGRYLVLSLSPAGSVADSSCRSASLRLRARGSLHNSR